MEGVLVMLAAVMAVIVIVGIVVIALSIAKKGKSQPSPPRPQKTVKTPQPSQTADSSPQHYAYRFRGPLLSDAEMRFYRYLHKAIGNEFLIFSKVRVADVLTPDNGLNRSDWQKAFNSVSAKHFDFVLCDPNNAEVKFAIELDDKTHRQKKRIDRDRFLSKAAQTANLKLVRFPVQRSYSLDDIKAQLLSI